MDSSQVKYIEKHCHPACQERLVSRVFPAVKTLVSNQKGTAVALLTTDAEVEELIALFEALAAAEGWQPGNDLRRYTDRSVYLAAIDEQRFAGGIQLVLGGYDLRLPCSSVWPDVLTPMRPDVAHVLILAVEKGCRGERGLFGLLSLCLWKLCTQRDITELWLESTPSKLHVYKRLGWPLCVRASLRPHWGEPCVLNSLSVAEAEAGVRTRPFWKKIVALANKQYFDTLETSFD